MTNPISIKEQIEQDIKKAMLSGKKDLVTTLRGLKSVILYAEVAGNSRDSGLGDTEVVTLLQKESKKRQESADLYRQGGNLEKAEKEEAEKEVIAEYLPEQLSEEDIQTMIEAEAKKLDNPTIQQMGQLIGAVKSVSKGNADGAIIARLAKEYLSR